MKAKLISSIALLCIAGSAFAAERAVEAVHYQVDASVDFIDYNDNGRFDEDSVSLAETLHGEVNLPIGP